jgi:flagellar hook-associated protein 1 FlgK
MSTFSGLNTAFTALNAARQGLDVVGQNIANVNTVGYTRQRATTSSIGGVAQTGVLSNGIRVGQGVSVDGIARLGDLFVDAKVRSSSASAGFWSVRATALGSLEGVLQEPGKNGISAQLSEFWAAWQDVSNRAGEPASAGVLLEQAGVLTSRIGQAYTAIEKEWAGLRAETDGMVAQLNSAAQQVAELNATIRSATATGGSVNEYIDKRSALMASIATLAGGTARETADGTVEVLIGGNALVSGDTFRPIVAAGGQRMEDGAADAVRLEWAHRPGSAVALDGGEIAAAVGVLAPATVGGTFASAAESLNNFARTLADKVNAVHRTGETSTGVTDLDFFQLDAALPAALGLSVVPTGIGGIASGTPGKGAFDGTIADAIAQVALDTTGPDATWSTFVTGVGVESRTAIQQSTLADISANSALNAQFSHSAVDMDEENVNMLTYQVAYQGAARVMTAVDEMLDTLINRTGLVGR